MPKPFFINSLYAICILIVGCSNDNPRHTKEFNHLQPAVRIPDLSIPGSFIQTNEISLDSNDIVIFIDSFSKFKMISSDLNVFYKKRNYAYAWFDKSEISEPAQHLYNSVINIQTDGLPDKILYKEKLIGLMEDYEVDHSNKNQLELMLTAQYLSYAKLAWNGLTKQQLASINWYLPRKESNYQELLDSLMKGKDVIQNAPVYYQYDLLKKQLQRFAAIKLQGGWSPIEIDKKKYKIGDTATIISKVKRRLSITGELKKNEFENVFDSLLKEAIISFQMSIGVKQTGLISPELIKSLNIPIEKRIEDIIVNMERCRWLPVELGNAHLLINIPEYRVHLFEHDSLKWDMKIVVGKNKNRTAIFSGEIKYVVFSPYWNVPESILKKEILPAIKRNPNYLSKHHMEWHDGGVRQLPGADNALGGVKFLFPNSHNIYLHDTPTKSLFEEDKRAFSHGCIRLAEPIKLAKYLLKNDDKWNDQKIVEAMGAGIEKYVVLKKTLPVYITYLTCWVDNKGVLQFRDDVYELNEKLLKMILEKPVL
jgi:murein L,D-transpeptidase YcbB/YkuD